MWPTFPNRVLFFSLSFFSSYVRLCRVLIRHEVLPTLKSCRTNLSICRVSCLICVHRGIHLAQYYYYTSTRMRFITPPSILVARLTFYVTQITFLWRLERSHALFSRETIDQFPCFSSTCVTNTAYTPARLHMLGIILCSGSSSYYCDDR